MADNSKVELIKSNISIPRYFEKLIIPEMKDYYSDYTVNFEARPVVKCPIHGEDTPSLRWYEDTNTFYCFGCRAGGDVINLHRLFMNVISDTMPTFDEAVEFMYNFFIQGIESTSLQGKNQEKRANPNEVQLSTNAEMIRLSAYVSKLEQTLQFDTSISKEHKQRIYGAIDNIHLLSSLNLIGALDGMDYIKQVVRDKEVSNIII